MIPVEILSKLIVFLATLSLVSGCSVLSWEHWSMERIMSHQEIVLYGKEVEVVDITNDEGQRERTDGIFEIFCVLKNSTENFNPDDPVPKTITIHQIWPFTSCAGTPFQYVTGQEILLGVKLRDDGTYEWDEPNVVPDGAAFDATPENLERAARVCGNDANAVPSGVTENRCPVVPADEACADGSAASIHAVMGMFAISGLFALILTI